jgi:peptidoglycan hydrolase-like protein with peptidoglycan-binding domain
MKTLAYLHLGKAKKAPQNLESVTFDRNFFKKLNWNKLPGKASIRFFSLTIALLIVGLTNSAFALVLKNGNSGSQVVNLQKDLSRLGFYKAPITGYYGSLTTSAVTRFQKTNGLTPDGVAGDTTLAVLQGSPNPNTNPNSNLGFSNVLLYKGMSGADVTLLQNRMTALRVYDGPITGYFGSLTEDAVIRFQQARGLLADGVVGPRTKAALASK